MCFAELLIIECHSIIKNCVVEVAKKLIFEAKGKGIGSSVMEFEGPGKAVEEMEGKDVTDMPDSMDVVAIVWSARSLAQKSMEK
jgi:hypothetical protein